MLRKISFFVFLFFVSCLYAQNGTFKSYYPSGKVASRMSFIKDVLEGSSFWYYENGNIKSEKNYTNGILNGYQREYYENGLLKSEHHYLNGVLDGVSKSYFENGSPNEFKNFDEGQLKRVTTLEYDSLYIAPLSAYNAGKQKKNIENNDFICSLEICPEPVGGIEEIESKIIYPELAIQYHLEGFVLISAKINKRGKAENIKVIKGLGLGCDEAAINAVKRTKFIPGRNNGDEIETEVTFKLNFNIPNKKISEDIAELTETSESGELINKEEVNSGSNFISCDIDECPQPIGGILELLSKLRYPPHAKRNNVSGEVILKAKIDEIGFVVGTEIIKGLGYGCDEAAKSVVLKTQFYPGKINGKDSESEIQITIPFIISED